MTTTQQKLDERIGDIKKDLAEAATGPLKAAAKVIALGADWDSKYKAEAKEDFQTFLRQYLGRGRDVRFFRVRADAAQAFGLRQACYMDHFGAVWLHQRGLAKVDADKVMAKVVAKFKAKNNNPLTAGQVRVAYADVMGTRMPSECPGCVELRAELARLREEVKTPTK